MTTISRRDFLVTVPMLGVAAAASAQTPTPAAPAAATPPLPQYNFPPPTLPMTPLTDGLKFPEGPVAMDDGSVLFVQIESMQISRLTPDGKVSLVKQLEGGPNGLAIGPDKALYIANDGGRFGFVKRGGYNFPGAAPPEHTGGSVQRLDLKTGELTTLYETCDGKRLVAPDDLVFDRHGGMWISDFGKKADGGVYYATHDGKKIVCAKPMNSPNGIGLSPDGKQLHISERTQLWTFDIEKPGVLSATPKSYPNGEHAKLRERSYADSLKVQADGKVCVCTLIAGGISIIDQAGATEFMQFNDPMVTNLTFGGKDMRDCWLTLSATGKMAKVRWPYAGLKPAYHA
ncbi:MAG TPA: SMP-30/gluconolactonase/LRE family protein [Steroidobacteraceae bacterium]|jgi:gluconolactonase|nr:SMP-30/gluconolactonase/LRE family protein [Steroidobacteraceae bacterium]